MAAAAYLARLRRAFLLRVHPDRFRTKHPERVRGQASLLQALSTRLAANDVRQWQQQQRHQPNWTHQQNPSPSSSNNSDVYKYVVELRDGSLQEHKICLGGGTSVDAILDSMQDTLTKMGAQTIPKPKLGSENNNNRNPPINDYDPSRQEQQQQQQNNPLHKSSAAGRTLHKFLAATLECPTQLQDIELRKQARLEAQAVALAVRQAYQFSAVDATALGWSSTSVAVLLRRFLDLQMEHDCYFRFYPLRLVFAGSTAATENLGGGLDVHAGVVRLTAAATPLQWLEALQTVTSESLEQVALHQKLLLERTKAVQALVGVKIRKGFSCPSHEYHAFLSQLVGGGGRAGDEQPHAVALASNVLSGVPALTVVVESASAVRRPRVTPQGDIAIGTSSLAAGLKKRRPELPSSESSLGNLEMLLAHQNQQELGQVVASLAGRAVVQRHEHRQRAEACRQRIQELPTRVTADPIVPLDELEGSLVRLQQFLRTSSSPLVVGHPLHVTARGRHCHVRDDGSLAVPVDWQ